MRRFGIVMKRFTSSLVLAGFLASAAGITFAVHAHHDHHGTPTPDCVVCIQLKTGLVGTDSAPVTLTGPDGLPSSDVPVAFQTPAFRFDAEPVAPRAPPVV
jgi:hypothetical protein